MYSSSTEVEYATDITLGRIVRFKKLSSATEKRCKHFCYAAASTACRLIFRKVSDASCSAFTNIFGCCLRENGTFRLHFLRIVLLTEFLTPIFISANPGRCRKFCKGSGQFTSKGTGVYYKSRTTF
jgi:hypothetical protein